MVQNDGVNSTTEQSAKNINIYKNEGNKKIWGTIEPKTICNADFTNRHIRSYIMLL